MKVALLSESMADEAALRVLVTGVLRHAAGSGPLPNGPTAQPPDRPTDGDIRFVAPGLRARGWPNVAQVLPAVIRHLHFNTDVDALVVSVDSDDSVVHTPAHDAPEYFHPQCRMCQLRSIFRRVTRKLPPAHGRTAILRGVGVAVPALEAWLLCGADASVTEARWADALTAGTRLPYTRAELKWRVYGTDRPSLPHETRIMVEACTRVARDPRRLEHDFPSFAALAQDVRSWHST